MFIYFRKSYVISQKVDPWHLYWNFISRWSALPSWSCFTLPEHPSLPPIFSGVRVTRSLLIYVCFGYRCLSFCTFSFGHCVLLFFFDIWILVAPFGIFKLFLPFYHAHFPELFECHKNFLPLYHAHFPELFECHNNLYLPTKQQLKIWNIKTNINHFNCI